MAQVGYVRLVNSNSSLDKRVRVLVEGHGQIPNREGKKARTVTGGLDLAVGGVKQRWNLKCKVYTTDPGGSAYATLADLRTFHGYSSPQGTPSNLLTFYDSEGVSYTTVMAGPLVERNIGPKLVGDVAWREVEFVLEEL